MMSDQKEDFVYESKMGYKVLRQIHLLEEPYPSKIAEELGSSYHSLRRYFKEFEEKGIVTKNKEGQKTIYSVNLTSLFELQVKIFDSFLNEVSISELDFNFPQKHENILEKDINSGDSLSDLRNQINDDQFFQFNRIYTHFYLKENKDSTLYSMMTTDFSIACFVVSWKEDLRNELELTSKQLKACKMYFKPYFVLNQGSMSLVSNMDNLKNFKIDLEGKEN